MGAPESGTELNARAVLKAAGLTYQDFAKVEYLLFGESVELMKNRQLRYFGIMADLIPPDALAALAATSISKASPMQTGVKATQIAIAGFVVPYMAVYTPALMLQGDGGWLATVYVSFKAIVAIVLWGGAAVGYLLAPLSVIERVLAALAALLLVAALPWTDEADLALGFAIIAFNAWRNRRSAQTAGA